MIKTLKEKNDSLKADCFVNPIKISFSYCKKIDCPMLYSCSKKLPENINCIKYQVAPISIKTNGFKHNATPSSFRTLLMELLFGSTTPNLKVNYLALTTGYEESNYLDNEKTRIAITPTTSGITGQNTTNFGLADCITTQVNYLSSSAGNKITVDDVTGLLVGDMITVGNLATKLKILAIDAVTKEITLNINIDPPVVGSKVNQYLTTILLLSNATGSIGTGDIMSVLRYIDVKKSTDTLNIIHNLTIS